MFPRFQSHNGLLTMQGVRRGNVDYVDFGIRKQFLIRTVEGIGFPFCRESFGFMGASGGYSLEVGFGYQGEVFGKTCGYFTQAQNAPLNRC